MYGSNGSVDSGSKDSSDFFSEQRLLSPNEFNAEPNA